MAGFVLANGSMSSTQSGGGEIRRALVEADLVDCMVASRASSSTAPKSASASPPQRQDFPPPSKIHPWVKFPGDGKSVPLLAQPIYSAAEHPKPTSMRFVKATSLGQCEDVSQCGEAFLIATERTITQCDLAESSTKIIPKFATLVAARPPLENDHAVCALLPYPPLHGAARASRPTRSARATLKQRTSCSLRRARCSPPSAKLRRCSTKFPPTPPIPTLAALRDTSSQNSPAGELRLKGITSPSEISS